MYMLIYFSEKIVGRLAVTLVTNSDILELSST